MKRDFRIPLINSFKLNFAGSQCSHFAPLKRAIVGKKDTGQDGSGVPIPALYKVTWLLSVYWFALTFHLEKKSSDEKMVEES